MVNQFRLIDELQAAKDSMLYNKEHSSWVTINDT